MFPLGAPWSNRQAMSLPSGRRLRAVSLLISLFALLGCGSDGPSVVLPLTAVTIRSVQADGSPLEAEFRVYSDQETSGFSTAVRTEGGIAEILLPAGSYRIEDREHRTFYSASGPVSDVVRADRVEVAGQPSLEIALRYASASIRLRSPGGERIAWNASAPRPIVFPRPEMASIRTEGDSLLVLGPMPVGDYLFASDPFDPNWPTTWYPSAPTFVTAQQVRLSAGQPRPIEITLLPSTFLVFDVPAPEILAGWSSHHCVVIPGLATEPGDPTVRRCSFDSPFLKAGPFPPGAHDYELELRWEGPDGAYSTRYLEGRATWSASETTHVTIDSSTGLDIAVDPPDADLTLYDDDGHAFARAHGSHAVLLAEPRLYRLAGSYRGRWLTYWPAAKFYLAGRRLEVTGELRRFEWSLVRSGTVRGRVIVEDDDGNLVSRWGNVRIYGDTWSRAVSTGIDGKFSIDEVWPGEYRLLATPYSEDVFPTWFGNTTERENAETFHLAEGEHLRDLEIRLVRR